MSRTRAVLENRSQFRDNFLKQKNFNTTLFLLPIMRPKIWDKKQAMVTINPNWANWKRIQGKLSDPSNHKNLFPCSIAQVWYNSLYNYEFLLLEAFFVNFPILTFWILMQFQVDSYPKDPNPPVKMWRIRNPDSRTLKVSDVINGLTMIMSIRNKFKHKSAQRKFNCSDPLFNKTCWILFKHSLLQITFYHCVIDQMGLKIPRLESSIKWGLSIV